MADRPMILARCGEDFELTLAALLNLWRLTNTTPPPYSTATGRGYNSKQQGLEPITSLVLACILNDPKNTAKLVPAVGGMIIMKTGTATKTYPSRRSLLNGTDSHYELINQVSVPFEINTLFELLCSLARYTAYLQTEEWNRLWRQHFELSIQVSPSISADLTWLPDAQGRSRVFRYYSQSKKRKAKTTIPARRVIMTYEHIEMIADLYRDTLEHETTAKKSEPQSSLTLSEDNDVPKNDDGAALAGAAPTRKSKTTAKQSQGRHSQEIKTESEISQPCRVGGLVTSLTGD